MVFRRGQPIHTGVPVSDGKPFSGILYLTQAMYDTLVAAEQIEDSLVYVTIDGTGTGDIPETMLAAAVQAKLLGTANVDLDNLKAEITSKLISPQASPADAAGADAAAVITWLNSTLIPALEAAGVFTGGA